MDVDLLRPGTVPIAPDTVLWFEFLLHQDLLLKHLQKSAPDPSPIQLITRFSEAISDTLRNRLENENGEIVLVETSQDIAKQPAKNIALKILSLKVAAFIKWDLSQLRTLPFKTQITLIQDLLYFASNQIFHEIPHIDKPEGPLEKPHLFALLIYHRWLLNVTMHRITSNWETRLSEISPQEENVFCSPENVQKTLDFLIAALSWQEPPEMVTFDCFKLPTEDNENMEFDWSNSEVISKAELHCQICYDLATFFFYKEDYVRAREYFLKCMDSFKLLDDKKGVGFVHVNSSTLEVYIRACNGPADGGTARGSLLEQLNMSIVNQYMGITTILQQDNIHREIPLCHRMDLELDIQGALSSGTFTVARDLLQKIRSLNVIRCVLDRKPLSQSSPATTKNVEILIWSIEVIWKSLPKDDQDLIKNYLMELILKEDVPDLLDTIQSNAILRNMFEKSEIAFIKEHEVSLDIPDSINKSDWTLYDFSKKRKPKLELKQLEQELISTYDYKQIRDLLVKRSTNPFCTNIWGSTWDLPIPLQSVIKSFPKGFLQDYSYVMLAKAREQTLNKNWNLALELMLVLDKELDSSNGNIGKLSRLISWEVLSVQITQLLDEWPNGSVDKGALANACEVCLQTNESVLPRTEIIEQCFICLLNLGRWEFLVDLDKRWSSLDIAAAIASGCQELVKHKGGKKFSKNLWDIVLPIFVTSPHHQQSKRGGPSGGNSSLSYHETHINNLKNEVMGIFSKLRDSTALTVVISMLTRLHNVLKDESSLEIYVEYAALWPAVVSNANSYSTKMTCEMLSQLVTQALTYYPTNIAWLRLMGDLNYVNNHHNISLKYYLKSLLIINDYFNIPIRHDDHVFRRMIKCCIALGCQTQAAVLCQFLEEPDYVLAFRILGEQKYCNDAVDAYYHCIWDTNILEYLIHVHNKKGEFQRRKCATQVIGLLELNSSNNEEIQREASNLRKSTFLRALCKQYVF